MLRRVDVIWRGVGVTRRMWCWNGLCSGSSTRLCPDHSPVSSLGGAAWGEHRGGLELSNNLVSSFIEMAGRKPTDYVCACATRLASSRVSTASPFKASVIA
jgi:hypothetical protein